GQGQRNAPGIGAHGRQITDIDRQRAPAKSFGRKRWQEMNAFYQRVDGQHQMPPCSDLQYRTVIANSQQNLPGLRHLRYRKRTLKEALDQLELTQRLASLRHDRARLAAPATDLGHAQPSGQLVENAIDELMGVGAAEFLRQLHLFVDDDPIRHVETLFQLIGTHAQQRQLDGVNVLQRAVQQWLDELVELAHLGRDAMQQFMEIGGGDLAHVIVDAEFRLDLTDAGTGHLPLVQGLQRELTRPTPLLDARPSFGSLRFVLGVAHFASICFSRLTISMADSAASKPLLPALVPERSTACSMLSTVSTPKATGVPVARAT